MISVGEASERILSGVEPLAGEPVATGDCIGRVLSESVSATIDSPPWDNASMDGYAVRSADLERTPVTLRVIEQIAAGAFPSHEVQPGEATRVMTGAPVPSGADTVIRREDTDDGLSTVSISNLRDRGKNIRRRGEDFRAGEEIFSRGDVLTAAHAGAIASAGIKTVQVHGRPTVALISSGDELVDLENFFEADAGRKIVSSNSITLAALVREAGGVPCDLGIARDDRASLRERFEAARTADLILTSAGISVGDHDHVRDVVTDLGGTIDFWKVRMRPGAPLAFGRIFGIPWIGMSGNPVSAIVTFEVFIRPVIHRMLGRRSIFPKTFEVTLGAPIKLNAPLMHFLRVSVVPGSNGKKIATLSGSQSSAVLTALARANALLILPGDRLEYAGGETHRALPIGGLLNTSPDLVLT